MPTTAAPSLRPATRRAFAVLSARCDAGTDHNLVRAGCDALHRVVVERRAHEELTALVHAEVAFSELCKAEPANRNLTLLRNACQAEVRLAALRSGAAR